MPNYFLIFHQASIFSQYSSRDEPLACAHLLAKPLWPWAECYNRRNFDAGGESCLPRDVSWAGGRRAGKGWRTRGRG
jgi:hypothetical protein